MSKIPTLKEIANRVYYARFRREVLKEFRGGKTYLETGEMFIRNEWVKDMAEFEQLMLDIEEMESR